MSTATADLEVAGRTTYDDVPYPSYPFAQSHPDHLYSLGRLFGLDAVLPDHASILEIGCASGGNLIPVAMQLPQARLLGIDLSQRQIDEGQQTIRELNLPNVELRAVNVLEFDPGETKFDYIVCHGVYSWVPPEVQPRIQQLCQQSLSENGIAYISYNTNPGWYMRQMIRDMMRHHVRAIGEAPRQVAQSRALLAFLNQCLEQKETPYAKFLQQELAMLSKQSDAYLYHEHLEEHNHPQFFHAFMQTASEHRLQYLGEANLPSMWLGNLPAKATETLQRLTENLLEREQYSDFVSNRTFRQTLLCHEHRVLNRHLDEHRLREARFHGALTQRDATATPQGKLSFVGRLGHTIETADRMIQQMLLYLIQQSPRSVGFEELIAQALGQLQLGPVIDAQQDQKLRRHAASTIVQFLVRGILDVTYVADRFIAQPSDRPTVSPLVRWQAASGRPATNQRHSIVQLDNVIRLLVANMDGSHTTEELRQWGKHLVEEGKLVLRPSAQGTVDVDAALANVVSQAIALAARSCLLVG